MHPYPACAVVAASARARPLVLLGAHSVAPALPGGWASPASCTLPNGYMGGKLALVVTCASQPGRKMPSSAVFQGILAAHWHGVCQRMRLPRQCTTAAEPTLWTCHCQVRVRDDEGAMAFGRAVLVREARSDEDMELLQDALSLLGYDDPATSPCGNLLGVKVPLSSTHLRFGGCGLLATDQSINSSVAASMTLLHGSAHGSHGHF